MIILVATATGQNSAYRHRNYEGRFRKRRRPSLFSVKFHKGFAPNNSLLYSAYVMPATLHRPEIADRLRKARRVQSEIDKLQRKLAALFAGAPKSILSRDHYGLTAVEMNKIARKLHARAKERIAQGRSKEFRGSIEDLL